MSDWSYFLFEIRYRGCYGGGVKNFLLCTRDEHLSNTANEMSGVDPLIMEMVFFSHRKSNIGEKRMYASQVVDSLRRKAGGDVASSHRVITEQGVFLAPGLILFHNMSLCTGGRTGSIISQTLGMHQSVFYFPLLLIPGLQRIGWYWVSIWYWCLNNNL